MEHRYVTVGGVRLHVAEAGAGEPVVLLHGFPQHWWEWRHLLSGLCDSFRVICPDQRGFGWSDAPPGASYAKEDLAREYVGLLDALGLERVRLVGHDWGGVIGFLICLHHPERVERYLALNTAHPFLEPDLASARHVWRLSYQYAIASPWLGRRLLSHGDQRAVRSLVRWVGGGWTWPEADAEQFLAQLREPERAQAGVELYRTFVLHESLPMTAGRYEQMRLRTPTLFLHGTRDGVIHPSFLRGFERYADDMTLELVEGAGHWIAEQMPDLVLHRAREFFAVR